MKNIKEISDKMISDLDLFDIKVRIRYYGIVEPDNKNLAFMIHLPTFMSKNQGSNSLTLSLKFVPLKPKNKNMTNSASFSNYWFSSFLSQYQGFLITLTKPILTTSLLEQKVTKSNILNKYKVPIPYETTVLYHLPKHEIAEFNSLVKHEVVQAGFSLYLKIVLPNHLL